MSSDESYHFQEEELYSEDDNDLYPPTSGANFWANSGFSINPSAPNNTAKKFTNPQKAAEVSNSTPSTSNRHEIDEKHAYKYFTPNDQSLPLHDTSIWKHIRMETFMKKNIQQENESIFRNNDLLAENDNLRNKVDQLEKCFVESQEQLNASQEQLNASQEQLNRLQLEKDHLRNKLDEYSNNATLHRKRFEELSQKHNELITKLSNEMKLLRQNYKESNNKDLPRDSLDTQSNSCATDAPIFLLPQLPSVQRSSTMPNDTQSQVQLTSTDMSNETYNEIDGENICNNSILAGQSTGMPLPSVEVNVIQNIDEEFNEHNAIEPANQMRLRSSSNNYAANLIQRKRTLTMNDHHSRTKLSVKRLNPKETNEMLYKCDHCSYASAWKGGLSRHMRTHTGERPFKCGHCTFACSRKDHLDRHVLIHTGEKPYKCDQCPYASVESSLLKNHIRTHTGEKPYKCDQCSYASAQKAHLICHLRTHTGEKPFNCCHCSYACATSGYLKVHIRTHTSEKPYKCFECPFACTDSSSLKKHMRIHTGEKP